MIQTNHFSKNNTFVPLANITEQGNGFVIEMVTPGFNKEDFKIEIANNLLTVSSEHTHKETTMANNYTLKEYSFDSFSRSFRLNEKLNQDEITAGYKNGILTLWIPKKEEAQTKPIQLVKVQ